MDTVYEKFQDDIPALTKLVTLRKDLTRYLSLRTLSKMTNEDDRIATNKYNTLCDPLFPLLRDDNFVVSKAMYDKQLTQHYTDLEAQSETGMT